jgi:hypothetical protein
VLLSLQGVFLCSQVDVPVNIMMSITGLYSEWAVSITECGLIVCQSLI